VLLVAALQDSDVLAETFAAAAERRIIRLSADDPRRRGVMRMTAWSCAYPTRYSA